MKNQKKITKAKPSPSPTKKTVPDVVHYKGSDYKDPTGSREDISTPKTSGYAEKQPGQPRGK